MLESADKVLEPLRRVLQEHNHLITNVDDEMEDLEKDMRLIMAKLKDDYTNFRRKSADWSEVQRKIRSKVYEIEDSIDQYTLQASEVDCSKYFISKFRKAPAKLLNVKDHIDDIKGKINDLWGLTKEQSCQESKIEQSEEMIKIPAVSNDNVKAMVGFEEEQRSIIARILEQTERLDVICIVGLPGLGKTTLAYKIFTDPGIESVFDQPAHRIWVNVSNEYTKKDVLLSILSHFEFVTDDTRCKTYHDITQLVWEQLEKSDRFLIVMDDVLSAETWMDLKGAFPKAHKTGKILITTQLEEVADCSNNPLRLGLLTPHESWELLQLEVFVNSICPPELEPFGKLIAENCDGLPLLIVMIGKVLKSRCSSGGMLDNRHEWEKVSASLSSCLEIEDFKNANTLFYDKLPYHLKPCFLYVGMFPEGFEIPVQTLMLLWMAEGFVHRMPGISLEQTALQYLLELINRNLVSIAKAKSDGHVKTCRVHCLLREFCRKEASSERENLFQEIEYKGENTFEHSISNLSQRRRLCVYSNVNGFLKSRPHCPLVRSFVCFSKEDLLPSYISSIPQVLNKLRVLEAKVLTFKMFPKDMRKLALLKYIVLYINFKVIPRVISKLRHMQTLIVYTTSPNLEIKANIWKMSQLRHLMTNVSAKLRKPKKGKEEGNQLQTLGMISHDSCTNYVFYRLHSLLKLSIHGHLNEFVNAKELYRLNKLEKLKLVNVLLLANTRISDGKLLQLPTPREFPENLRSLTLYSTNLDWRHMSTLGNLLKLELLKLKENAFIGDSWVASDYSFPRLQILHIVNHKFVTWEASVNSFPILRCLMLCNCTRLEEIPCSLSESLQKLYLKGALKESVVASARRIQEMKKDLILEEAG